jgi:hypothetical protein
MLEGSFIVSITLLTNVTQYAGPGALVERYSGSRSYGITAVSSTAKERVKRIGALILRRRASAVSKDGPRH